jgi:hypothetical protein
MNQILMVTLALATLLVSESCPRIQLKRATLNFQGLLPSQTVAPSWNYAGKLAQQNDGFEMLVIILFRF